LGIEAIVNFNFICCYLARTTRNCNTFSQVDVQKPSATLLSDVVGDVLHYSSLRLTVFKWITVLVTDYLLANVEARKFWQPEEAKKAVK